MIKNILKHCSKAHRLTAFLLAAVMVFTCIPNTVTVEASGTGTDLEPGKIVTEADPETLTRPVTIYGDSTLNSGKITVGKSVSEEEVTIPSGNTSFDFEAEEDNFLVTFTQTAQVMGLSTEIPVPIDAVFVLDTSGSMDDDDRFENMVVAANNAIKTLLESNPHNRVGVVAFSSAGGDNSGNSYGGGTSENKAASVLSSLARYDDNATTGVMAASAHLQRVNSDGEVNTNGTYVAGRNVTTVTYTETEWQKDRWGNWKEVQVTKTKNINNYRNGQNGGTHIQAGIALGAKQLMAVQDTTVEIDGRVVNRVPFLIVLSDGAPTFSSTTGDWYNPSLGSYGNNNNFQTNQNGDGNTPYEGNGFLAALTAAYYKGAITDHYFGANATAEDRCSIYTIGVGLDSLDGNNGTEKALAQITMDPKTYTTGNYAANNAVSYYKYGNTFYQDNARDRSTDHSFKTYWDNYVKGNDFSVRVNSGTGNGSSFTITDDTIALTKNYVNGNRVDANNNVVNMGYTGGLAYNDGYFGASNAAGLNAAFEAVVREIQLKAITAPTKVTAIADFDGYVHLYDPIGEYMEVKDIKGIVTDGHNFRGASFARMMKEYGTNTNPEFDQAVTDALKGRLALTGRLVTEDQIKTLVEKALAADNQLYHNSNEDFDNSFCWWGSSYQNEYDDIQVQYLEFAENDTVEYITDQNTVIPEGADYVCRSYYFYGTAGGEVDPIADFLLFTVRVQRSLEDPYQQAIIVSAPATMLSVEKVLITEKTDGSYTATVQKDEPVRLIYEVGLRDDINAQSVAGIVSDAYKSETVAHDDIQDPVGLDNYDAATDTYYFYTNDWDRSKTESSHERAMTKVSFDASLDNNFYNYQEDTPILNAQGQPVKGTLTPGTYYYKRVYYDWDVNDVVVAGTYDATQKDKLIKIELSAAADSSDAIGTKADGSRYIKAGTYTAYSLSVEGDDTTKASNNTETSAIVAHPIRTEDYRDSHYTVYLGNNGRLALTADKAKTVSVSSNNVVITDGDGKVVTVGDELTYYIELVNSEGEDTTATVTDMVPKGTVLVENSITDRGVYDPQTREIKWSDINLPASATAAAPKVVSFTVKVTEAALEESVVTVNNTASIQIGNNPAYNTNKTENPPQGKMVDSVSGSNAEDGVYVGKELSYTIRYYNEKDEEAIVTITDNIPAGTTYLNGTASNGGEYNADTKTLTWSFNVLPKTSGYVTFRVVVDESAKTPISNGATITIGETDPEIEYKTNTTEVDVLTGDLVLSKTVSGGNTEKEFEFVLTSRSSQEPGYGTLNGTYTVSGNASATSITFENGIGKINIKHGETATINDLPVGLILNISETTEGGYTPAYSTQTVTIVEGDNPVSVDVINTYKASPVKFQLKGTKNLTTAEGAYFPETTFSILVQTCDADWNPVTVGTSSEVKVGTNNPTDTLEFAERTFTAAGTYRFLITELNTSLSGVTYDAVKYRLTIDVEDDGNGNLVFDYTTDTVDTVKTSLVKVTASGEEEVAIASLSELEEKIVFNNSYEPAEYILNLTGTKEMTGINLAANTYAFQVVAVSGGDSVSPGDVVATGTNAAGNAANKGTITFSPIVYSEDGTYIYEISEVPGGNDNVTYEDTVYTLTVVVTDKSGKLEVTSWTLAEDDTQVAAGNGTDIVDISNQMIFANTFKPDDEDVILEAVKVFRDEKGQTIALSGGEFRFQVKDVSSGDVLATGANDKDGKVTFTPIFFDMNDVGTHTFEISEIIPELAADPSIDYDESKRTVTVTVSYDSENGELVVGTPEYIDGNTFTNTDYPDSVPVTPEATKITTVSGGSALGDENTFSIVIKNVSSGNVIYTGSAKVDSTAVSVQFNTVNYSTPGTYKYWIYESNAGIGRDNGITYDANRYLMEVTIERENGQFKQPVIKYFSLKAGGNKENVADYTDEMQSAPQFKNSYNAEGYLNLTATKKLVDKADNSLTLDANKYTFKLERMGIVSGNDVITSQNGEVDGSNSVAGNEANNVTFPTLYYSSADLPKEQDIVYIRYKMSENIPTLNPVPGVTYDKSEYYVTVKLSHVSGGDINAELYSTQRIKDVNGTAVSETEVMVSGGNSTGITFTNVYAPITGDDITIKGSKTLNGRATRSEEFTFGLYNSSGTLVDTATNKDLDSDGDYDDVLFERNIPASTTPGIYEFTIKEINTGLKGVEYDQGSYKVYVQVIDLGNGSIEAKLLKTAEGPEYAANENVFSFTNTYTATSVDVKPEITKTLIGRDMRENEFSFTVFALNDNGAEGDAVAVGTSAAANDGVPAIINFTPITYTDRVGTNSAVFKYVIKENLGTEGGVNYNTAISNPIYMSVSVSDAGEGILEAEETYYSDSSFKNAIVGVPNFTNTYEPADGRVQLHADKKLTGRDLEANEFDFVVRALAQSGSSYTIGDIVVAGDNGGASVSGNAAEAAITFGEIGYTDEGTYYYLMSEVTPPVVDGVASINGVTFDTRTYVAVVEVEDNGSGNLVIAAGYPKYYPATVSDNKVSFANTASIDNVVFENAYVPAKAELTLSAEKILQNKDLKSGEFKFVLKEGNTEISVSYNDAEGIVTFDTIEYTSPGKHIYTIAEVKDYDAGLAEGTYTYDPTIYRVEVNVTDNLEGELVVDVTYIREINNSETEVTEMEFINGYTPDDLPVKLNEKISATKKVTDPNGNTSGYTLSGNDFEFTVKDNSGQVVALGYNDADGNVTFYDPVDTTKEAVLEFKQANTYHYVVNETPTDKDGFTANTQAWDVYINIIYDNAAGELKVDYIYSTPVGGRATAQNEPMKFVNIYDPAPAKLTVSADKQLTLIGTDARLLKEHEFKFQLIEVLAGGAEVIVAETHNEADTDRDRVADINFAIEVNTAGEHVYKIVEVVPAEPASGITYDTEVKDTFTIKVVDDGSGQLKIDNVAEITKDSGLDFVNKYDPADTTATITATKILDGRTLKDGEFTFELVSGNDVVATGTNDALGHVEVKLPDNYFKQTGSYIFTLHEVAGTDKNVTYDDSVYTVTIDVKDNLVGQLYTEITYGTADGIAPVFTNTYTPPVTPPPTTPKVLVQLEGTKTLNGGKMTDGQFKFEIHLSDGTPKGSGTSKADGTIDFYEMAFDTVGKHVLVITEVNDGQAGITYDSRKFEVIVDVYDHYGMLKANVYYPEGGIAFVNNVGGFAPKTGDNSPIMIFLAALLICGAGLGGLLVWRKKREQEN